MCKYSKENKCFIFISPLVTLLALKRPFLLNEYLQLKTFRVYFILSYQREILQNMKKFYSKMLAIFLLRLKNTLMTEINRPAPPLRGQSRALPWGLIKGGPRMDKSPKYDTIQWRLVQNLHFLISVLSPEGAFQIWLKFCHLWTLCKKLSLSFLKGCVLIVISNEMQKTGNRLLTPSKSLLLGILTLSMLDDGEAETVHPDWLQRCTMGLGSMKIGGNRLLTPSKPLLLGILTLSMLDDGEAETVHPD